MSEDLGVCQAWPSCREQAVRAVDHPAFGENTPACEPHAADVESQHTTDAPEQSLD